MKQKHAKQHINADIKKKTKNDVGYKLHHAKLAGLSQMHPVIGEQSGVGS